MSEVLPKDILLRVGGRTLQRHGVLAVAGSRRGLVDVPLTFARADASTCATYIDRDGIVRLAAAGVPRIEWVDLDGDGIRETPGLLLEGSRQNLCLRSEEFDNGTWTGAATHTANTDVAPDGTTTADTITDSDGAAFQSKAQAFTVANDSLTHVISVFVKKTAAATNTFGLNLALTGGTGVSVFPRLNTNSGVLAGAAAAQVLSVGNYWVLICPITNNTTGNTSLSVQVFPATGTNSGSNPGSDNVAATGSAVVWGAQVEKAAFRSSYIKTVASAITRAADSFTLPFNFGPMDCTVLWRMARPVWADVSGDIGQFLETVNMGGLNDPNLRIQLYFAQSSRQFRARFGTSASDAGATILAGSSLSCIAQCKDAATAPAVAVDVGGGLTAFDTGAPIIPSYPNQTLSIGYGSSSPHGVLLDLMVLRGLFSYSEAGAVP